MREQKEQLWLDLGCQKCPVNISLRQGSAVSPLLFIMVMELISRKISTKDVLRKMMYADDLAIIAESKQELQEVLEEWKGVFEKHGLRMSLEKTEVMWVGHQREELNIMLDGKEIKQVDGFVYLIGMVGIQRQKCNIGHKREQMLGER